LEGIVSVTTIEEVGAAAASSAVGGNAAGGEAAGTPPRPQVDSEQG
jgi:hypothetical protein